MLLNGIKGGVMKIIWTAILLLSLSVACSQPGLDVEAIQNEIQNIILRQKTAWNAHDIEGFMADYWKSENMTFQSGNNRLKGWETLLTRYKTNYAGEKMGKLTFSDIEIYVLNKNIVYALGRWKVEQEESVNDGVYTIILKRFPGGWKIIHDHSS